MSRSPSRSMSTMTAERVPRAPQTVTGPVAPAASGCPLSLPGGVELEPRRHDTPLPRLDAEAELGVDEAPAAIVELDGIDHVALGIIHPGRNEHVVEPVGVEVADARAPRAVALGVDRVGGLAVGAAGLAAEERVAPDAGPAVAAERHRPLHRRFHPLALRRDGLAHVGVHVGDEDVEAAVVVEVEDLDAHGAPRRSREHLPAPADEPRAVDVLVILIVAEHVEHVEIGPAIGIDVDHAGIARPRPIAQAGGGGDIDEAVVPLVVEEDALLRPLGLEVAGEGILEGHVIPRAAVAGDGVGRIAADVDEEQIEPAVVVVVEEDGGRRMADVAEAGGGGNIAEPAVAVVLEQHVAAADGGDVEIGVAVVVDIGKGRRHADLAGDGHAGRGRDVLEPAAAEVAPQLVAAGLRREVDIGEPVAVDVGDRDPVAVIVMRRLVALPGVVNDVVREGDAAVSEPVGELEVVENVLAGQRLDLRRAQRLEPPRIGEIRRDDAPRLARGRRGRGRRRPPGGEEHRRGCGGDAGEAAAADRHCAAPRARPASAAGISRR